MQAYVAWTNSQLKKRPGSKVVEDLARDMQDGVALAQLIEIVGTVQYCLLYKACRTRELTVTREHWRKQVPPVCGKILKDFWHA